MVDFSFTFLPQLFCKKNAFVRKNISKSVRPVLAALSVNGLINILYIVCSRRFPLRQYAKYNMPLLILKLVIIEVCTSTTVFCPLSKSDPRGMKDIFKVTREPKGVHFDLEFYFSSHLCQMWLNRDWQVVCGEGDRSTQRKPPPNPKSLATFSHAHARIRTQAVARDSVQSVAAP